MSQGSILDPFTLAEAILNNGQGITPGDTVYLRGGTYSGPFTAYIRGLAGYPVTFRAYPGERPILDGGLTIHGEHTTWIGLEVTDSTFTSRSTEVSGATPPDINGVGSPGIDPLADNVQVINCHVHNFRQGIGGSQKYKNVLLYGNLIYHNGWYHPTGAWGHGIYPQNGSGTPRRLEQNVIFDQFGYGVHAYGSGGLLNDFEFVNNTIFNSGLYSSRRWPNLYQAGAADLVNVLWRGNQTYYAAGVLADIPSTNHLGDPDNSNYNVRLVDNYMANDSGYALSVYGHQTQFTAVGGNTYVGPVQGFTPGETDAQEVAYPASGQHVSLYPNAYQAGRALLTIYNWAAADSVTVDVSAVYAAGQAVHAHNVQDYHQDIQALEVAGDGTLTLDMQAANRSVQAPVGWAAADTTFPAFGCFVLEL